MRHTPEAIRQFLIDQPRSGHTVADFCEVRGLKVPTFYSWKRKYEQGIEPVDSGFFQIKPKRELVERSLRLPSGLQLEVVGLSVKEIAMLIVEIDRAHA